MAFGTPLAYRFYRFINKVLKYYCDIANIATYEVSVHHGNGPNSVKGSHSYVKFCKDPVSRDY